MANKVLTLQPIKGKYIKVDLNERSYDIFKVDPRTDDYGTEVDYDDAIQILSTYSKLVTLTPKSAKSVDKEILEKIKAEQEKRIRGLKISEKKEDNPASKVDEEVKNLIANQAELIKLQTEKLATLEKEIEALKASTPKSVGRPPKVQVPEEES